MMVTEANACRKVCDEGKPVFRVFQRLRSGAGLICDYEPGLFEKLFLLCSGCGLYCIGKPAGATDKTTYLCRLCVPLGVPDGQGLDRCGFDNFKGSTSLALSAMLEAETAETGKLRRYKVPGRGIVEFVSHHYPAICEIPGSRILKAQVAREGWAMKADRRAIDRLPAQQRAALLAFYWGGMAAKEIAEAMRVSERAVETYLTKAKKNILENQG
jgi:hypothetical protein